MKAKVNDTSVPVELDYETRALVTCVRSLEDLTFDQKWRVLNYLLVRLLNRTWSLSKPKGEE